MEGRMSRYRQVSPERTIVWTERSPKYQQVRKVPVVYYLCRNRHLEHPHFIEVPLSSTQGLYLRDVINRLNVLRGRGMASLYSWSCKRSYKNGFVWHDLCEDDLILPAHGNEYVLKGSELYDESSPGLFSPPMNVKVPNLKQLPEPISSRSPDDSSSSSSLNEKEGKHNQAEDEVSPPLGRPESSGVSPEYRLANASSSTSSLSLTEYKISRRDNAADASTQTEENVGRPKSHETCVRGVSTDDIYCEDECNDRHNQVQCAKETSNICKDTVSTPPSSSSASSSGGRTTETLESLIRADASKINSFRMIEEEEEQTTPKLKPTSVLMQLISCGSISVKDHSIGLIPNYRARVSHSKFPSPLFSTSTIMIGDLDCLSQNPKLIGPKFDDKEYFSGSLIDAKVHMEGRNGCTALKRSSSYNADRTSKQLDSPEDKVESTSAHSKCIPRSIKASLSRQPRSESMQSPASDGPRNSADGVDRSQRATTPVSNGSSKRISEPSPMHPSSKRLDSFREDGNVIKIEERLASGARVIIQSKT